MNNIFTTIDHHGRSVYETVQAAPWRFYARFLQYLPDRPLTPEQQAEADASEAEYRAMCESFGRTPDSDEQFDYYTTDAAARRATELHDAMSFTCDDISAFGAGGMGLEVVACRSLEAELDELEFKYADHGPIDPYAERGIENRTYPMGEALGLGPMADDYDVLAALGERPAMH